MISLWAAICIAESMIRAAFPFVFNVTLLLTGISGWAADKPKHEKDAKPETGSAVLWADPTDIASRNLYYGPGGEADQPRGRFTFVEEDMNGTNPKIVVKDEDGTKWTVKLGAEARPETAASRLIWGIGYFANEDYFVPRLEVEGMPAHLHRGGKMVAADGSLPYVRLKRHLKDEKKISDWAWRDSAFSGTRELNGLRAMMALINDWDLTDENNAIFETSGDKSNASVDVYMVSDVGSTFGGGRLTWPLRKGRGDLRSYERSKFITRMTADTVDFYVPTRPSFFFLATPHEFLNKLKLRWIGRRVPRADAKWLGQELARLSPQQIRDAFRAAGYSPQEVEAFASVVERRISTLQEL